MINMNKTYAENIAAEENKHLQQIVEDLLSSGKMDEKYRLLLGEDSICNIVLLSVLNIHGRIKTIQDNNKNKIKYADLRVVDSFKKHLSYVGKLYETLSFDLRKRLAFAIGLHMIIDTGIDEVKEFSDTMIEINNQLNTKTLVKPVIAPGANY